MRHSYTLLLLLLIVTVGSCCAKPIRSAALSGPWAITVTTPDAGLLRLSMSFEVDKQQGSDTLLFHAFTRKNVDKEILGGTKAILGRLAGSGFRDGSLLRIVDGRLVRQDTLSGVLASPFGNYYVQATLRDGSLIGVLKDGHYHIVGTLGGKKGPHTLPMRNYPGILDTALLIASQNIYDPALPRGKEWKHFEEQMQHVSHIAEDDAAFVMAFFYYARKLPFSHFTLHIPAGDSAPGDGQTKKATFPIEEKGAATAYVKIGSFAGDAYPMEHLFEELADKPFKNLIVDLRANPGGSIEAGMAFARHLLRDTVFCGVFLTQKYFREQKAIPAPGAFSSYPHFSEANYGLLMKGISEYPAICLKAYPAAPAFTGKVYILCDGGTASTCEPIIYALKQHHLAMIVGSTTAGAMLSSEAFPITDGFVLHVPTATYYTADGFKIDQKGVVPDIDTKGEDALAYVLKRIAASPKHE
jgi:hypothetical protein